MTARDDRSPEGQGVRVQNSEVYASSFERESLLPAPRVCPACRVLIRTTSGHCQECGKAPAEYPAEPRP